MIEAKRKLQWLSYLPNIITIGRIIALGPLVWFLWHKDYQTALIITFFAGLSDGLDGFLAKRFGWQGWLGGILDPLADKAMMLLCYLVLAWQSVIPAWLFLMVVLRDLLIVLGTSYYHFKIGRIKQAQPTFLSKCNTVLQILLILFLLLDLAEWWHLPFGMNWLFAAVAFTTLTTGIQYILIGRRMARQEQKTC